jgi:uncharacterized DUF497 family protein
VFLEWDQAKEVRNRRKHGVSFAEAATVFGDPLSKTFPDLEHSEQEERYLTLGASESGKILVIAHLEEGDNIRIINARPATRRERRFYEEQKT